ncbi:unnamed protein product [Moneuplotes crassus]|uniref:Uncharacterized protein n=1 Tax=Euplotes crassus TaxID=5936 RepID=A0AAD1Y1S3_EUPCR|nr:unnamed protein product [Moneuplotes crassus]
METCRWDTTTTGLACFSFGVLKFINFVPISSDLLFSGSVDTSNDQYYCGNYNFSDTLNLVGKKSIVFPTSGCANKRSDSLLSQNKESIYTMILYDNHFLFYKNNSSDGTPQNSGFFWSESGVVSSYIMREFNNFIEIQIQSTTLPNSKRMILIDTENSNVLKEYNSVNSLAYGIGRLEINGQELM